MFTRIGCGEDNCKYCKGETVSSSDEYKNFVYYDTVSTLSIVSVSVASCMLVSGGIFLYLALRKKK